MVVVVVANVEMKDENKRSSSMSDALLTRILLRTDPNELQLIEQIAITAGQITQDVATGRFGRRWPDIRSVEWTFPSIGEELHSTDGRDSRFTRCTVRTGDDGHLVNSVSLQENCVRRAVMFNATARRLFGDF